MKAKVVKKFIDKYTGELHKPGEVIKISKKRYEEILAVGNFVEEVKTEE